MPAEEAVKARPSLRERRRAAAVQEIVDAAERHIVANGPAALSLRAVARDLGMTVQALYHYFPSWADLLTALIVKAYDDMADAVQAAVDSAAEDSGVPRVLVAAEEYRRWAVTHPERFQLIYGTPLRQYEAPANGPTTRAMIRMSRIFQRVMFEGFSAAQLGAADHPALSPSLRAYLAQLPPNGLGELPPPAVALLLNAWGHLHGLVVLEVSGHTSFLGGHQAEIFRMGMRNMVEDVHRRIPPAGAVPAAGAAPTSAHGSGAL
ncbi:MULTISPECIES: TetR/AcrR family transcriptional regulator [Streptomyces]|uniref:TetR/AcrR family transcriptional regulator n=1 Tax=Streptomyces tsukubensis (strain DSM 42081 / NBRC 108919 / NRRL 18488 / 9993) TaxID=1114943 RepID=A0A7G3UAE6_STRT9|nr:MULTISPECIES: TetR/AcrR family transcriptional regulator [Streptomyces]AZK98007.1 TetR family transcriptional regulator [Streptomyces tsukubensis]MYS64407.1 TetR family transcriptional regulator [Streptomyces sp. SID5473]QKM66070.1 TetR/AcrR family transcriptional regulator [Streptomyces tsukubensis NRRL18488]TAI42351.1 TetR/AcrR family transcriptional regulator [Streptomyces tsukubensis]